MSGGYFFWLGASADADRAAHEPSQSSLSQPSGEHPLRDDILLAFRDLTIACVEWADASDECLIHYPVEEMERAMALLDPIFGEGGSVQ